MNVNAAVMEGPRGGALVVSRPERGTLVVTGADRLSWLNAVITSDVSSLCPGTGSWALALTKQGRIQSDLVLVPNESEVFISTAPGRHEELTAHLDSMLIMEDAELADRSDAYSWFEVHGPKAVELKDALQAEGTALSGTVDFTGLGGAAVVLPRGSGEEKMSGLTAQLSDVTLGSAEDWRNLRVERLVPEWRDDFDVSNTPHEARLDRRCVSWTKGCYLGQEVVCMQDMRGKVRRCLELLVLDGDEPVEVGTAVEVEGADAPAGQVTSAGFSRVLGKTVALAMLRTKFRESALHVGARRAHIRADPV